MPGEKEGDPFETVILAVNRKKENKYPPLLFNLAELQNECSKRFKISPDETLRITQELYEKKMVTYPRTDARVLSTAVAKEIRRNLSGLKNFNTVSEFAQEILEKKKAMHPLQNHVMSTINRLQITMPLFLLVREFKI